MDTPRRHPGHSIAEAADMLGLSTRTVRRMIKDGRLAASVVHGLHGDEYRIGGESLAGSRRGDGPLNRGGHERPQLPANAGLPPARAVQPGHPGQAPVFDIESLRTRLRMADEAAARREQELLDEIRYLSGEMEKVRESEARLRDLLTGATSLSDLQATMEAPARDEPDAEAGHPEEPAAGDGAEGPPVEPAPRVPASRRRVTRGETGKAKTERQRLREAAVLSPEEILPEPEPEPARRSWWRLNR